jgi:hypothetical protein
VRRVGRRPLQSTLPPSCRRFKRVAGVAEELEIVEFVAAAEQRLAVGFGHVLRRSRRWRYFSSRERCHSVARSPCRLGSVTSLVRQKPILSRLFL